MTTSIASILASTGSGSVIYETSFIEIKASIEKGILKDFPGNRRNTDIAAKRFMTHAKEWDKDISSESPVDICIFRNEKDIIDSNSNTIKDAAKKEHWKFPFAMVADGHGRWWSIQKGAIRAKNEDMSKAHFRIHPTHRFLPIFDARNSKNAADKAGAPDSHLRRFIENSIGAELRRDLFKNNKGAVCAAKMYVIARYIISTKNIPTIPGKYSAFTNSAGSVKKVLSSYTRSTDICNSLDKGLVRKISDIYSQISIIPTLSRAPDIIFSVSMFLFVIGEMGFSPKPAFYRLLENEFDFAKWYKSNWGLTFTKATERTCPTFEKLEGLLADKANTKLFKKNRT
jgi:hypothetical protein